MNKETVKVELTERELDCLIGFIEVDEQILNEIYDYEEKVDENDFATVMLRLLANFRQLRGERTNEQN